MTHIAYLDDRIITTRDVLGCPIPTPGVAKPRRGEWRAGPPN